MDKSGWYYAVCNSNDFKSHYVRKFFYPIAAVNWGVNPAWWFLNNCNGTACVDKVYPCDIFADENVGIDDSYVSDPQ